MPSSRWAPPSMHTRRTSSHRDSRTRSAGGCPSASSVELATLVPTIGPQGQQEKPDGIRGHVGPVGGDAAAFDRRTDRVPHDLRAAIERQVRRYVLQEL